MNKYKCEDCNEYVISSTLESREYDNRIHIMLCCQCKNSRSFYSKIECYTHFLLKPADIENAKSRN